jgi:hypothetical protein
LEHDKIQAQVALKYFVIKNVGKGMMVQMLQDGILKSNHLLFDELFKRRKIHACWGQ